MSDKELMLSLLENGFVVINSNKFYREVRAIGLNKIVEMLNINKDVSSSARNYIEFETGISSYLRTVRDLVVNDENYNTIESDDLKNITALIREVGDKYIISNRANENRMNIKIDIDRANEDLIEMNRDLAKTEEELASTKRARANLNRTLIDLSNDTSISNIERTEQTFDIMAKITENDEKVFNCQNTINNIREIIRAQMATIDALNNSYNEVVEVSLPIIDKEFNAEFTDYINRINEIINNSALTPTTRKEVRRLSANLISLEALPFKSGEISERKISELCERFGLAKTNEYLSTLPSAEKNALPAKNSDEDIAPETDNTSKDDEKDFEVEITEVKEPEVTVVPIKSEDESKEEKIGIVFITPDEEQRKEKDNDAEVKSEEDTKEESYKSIADRLNEIFSNIPNSKEEKKEETNTKKIVVYTGRIGKLPVNSTYFAGLEAGKKYVVEYEDEATYRLKGFDTSFIKDAFIPAKSTDIYETSIEEPKYKSKFKVGDEIALVANPNINDSEKELMKKFYFEKGLKWNQKYKVTEIAGNDLLKLEGFDEVYPDEYFINGKDFDALRDRLIKGLATTSQKLVKYNGPSTDELIEGEIYVEVFPMDNSALLRDIYGNEITVMTYNRDLFVPYQLEALSKAYDDKREGYFKLF